MKNVPFYPNHEDDMHCMLAVYRSLFDFFLHRKMTWKELESFTGYKPKRAAWTLKSLVQMQRMGFDIRMIEAFDYERYNEEGRDYLKKFFTKEQYEWQIENSNILDLRPHIAEFLKHINYEKREPTLNDIDSMLDDGRLVFLTINSRALNDEEGYIDHAVLVIARDETTYTVHDPGGEPQANRIVDRDKLLAAMTSGNRSADATGFKLQPGYDKRGMRLDQYLVRERPSLSRAYAVKLIDNGDVLVNGKQQKAGYKLKETDDVAIEFEEADLDKIPDIDLPVIYQDDNVLVINKPAGVISHSRGRYWDEPSVASFVRQRIRDDVTWDSDDRQRAGIVHRLDRATSGVMICAKNAETMKFLQKQFGDRQAAKTYVAIIKGHLEESKAIIDLPIERNPKKPQAFRVGINGKPSVTAYEILQENDTYQEVCLKPKTGRTHQLRVHLKHLGHPIVGDTLYDGEEFPRLLLHALSLEITMPDGNKKLFEAPLPDEFKEFMGNDK